MAENRRRVPLSARALGHALGLYLRSIRATNRVVFDPPDFYVHCDRDWPVIFAFWHGEHFMLPLLPRPGDEVRALISRSADGEAMAIATRPFGIGLVRGAGGRARKQHRKGGPAALRGLVTALREGASVGVTADVPKGPARIAGPGIVTLAKLSGRPIFPVGAATSRHLRLRSTWDRSAVNLPFGRLVFALGTPLRVAEDAGAAQIETARMELKARLDETTARAYAIACGDGA
jgi:lysophospholipid acyltransferase (LPLAT)-like uncharacterized protein